MNINENSGASIYEQLNLTQPVIPASDSLTLGQDDFLQLMTTQLQNQDPFSPLENGEFISQMAQFGTVTGIESLQKSFDGFAANLQSNRALEASVMVGRSVLVPGAQGTLEQGGTLGGAVFLPAAASNVVIKIFTPAGELVATRSLGAAPTGIAHFDWDGLDEAGNAAIPGSYTIEAEAQIGNETEQVGTLLSGNVDSVTLGSGYGDFTLHVAGIGDVRIDDIVQIN
jgi:flagellar basal-body rod modification protein FlgD